MKVFKTGFKGIVPSLLAVGAVLFANPAFAVFTPTDVGDVVQNTIQTSSDIPTMFAAVAYLAGCLMGVLGIVKLKDHVTDPRGTPLSDAVKRILVAGCCFALPMVIEAARDTLAGGASGASTSPNGFNTTATGPTGLDAIVINFMKDMWGPLNILIAVFCYVAGLILIFIGISRLLKSAQDGPRGPSGLGTIMTFLVGGALLSVDVMMDTFNQSFGFGGQNLVYADLQFTAGMTTAELERIHNVISAVLAFMIIIGWISFVRGWFILRDVAEGGHQASIMAGLTHIFGGALAVNLGPVLNMIQSTFGISTFGIKFT